MSSSATVSASVCTAASRGAFIELPPVPVISVLALRHSYDQPVERLADLELAGEAGGGRGEGREAQHSGLLRGGGRGEGEPKHPPRGIEVACGAAAPAAA